MPVTRCPYCKDGSDFTLAATVISHLDEHVVTAIAFCILCDGQVYMHFDNTDERVLS